MSAADHFDELQKYKDFAPTGFDARGLNADDTGIGEFRVLLSRTRDSDALEESNFRVALKSLGGESEHVQVHRFNHWACGWFELLLVSPNAPDEIRKEAGKITSSLSEYPILDEMDFSGLEIEYGEIEIED